jgi:cation transport regulator ChaB
MPDNAETIGSFTFAVAFAGDADERFEQRSETLTAWLLARWQAQRKEAAHADDGHGG